MNRNDRWAGWQRDHVTLSPREQRREFAVTTLATPPQAEPATSLYTSDGYLIAGSMLERAAGVDFEQLARERMFAPLGLTSMTYGGEGHGPPRVLGHEARRLGPSRPVPYEPAEYGARPFGAPAGFLRATVPDLLRYLDFHLRGDNGSSPLLDQQTLRRLHRAPAGEPFALGWQTDVMRNAAGEPQEHSVYHGGYTGRSRANVWFVPETGWATAIVTNDGRGDESITADIFYALLREFDVIPRP
jgi:CubicO group peptidase (beta-lactamase class C family)